MGHGRRPLERAVLILRLGGRLLCGLRADPPRKRGADAPKKIAVDRRRFRRRLSSLERLADHPLLPELAAGGAHVVGEHEDRFRGGFHLGPGVVGKADRPPPQLLHLGVVHALGILDAWGL